MSLFTEGQYNEQKRILDICYCHITGKDIAKDVLIADIIKAIKTFTPVTESKTAEHSVKDNCRDN